jgi:inorganic pyrophosphatase
MDLWHDLDIGKNAPEKVTAIVESPTGSVNKYEVDKKTNLVKLDRVLFSPVHYPGDYGFIPQTYEEDGDPLDVVILVSYPVPPGTMVQVRPIGAMKMVDNGEQDDKILCVPVKDPRFATYKDLGDVQKHLLDEIVHFFEVYKHLEGKKVDVNGWKNAKTAKTIIKQSMARYKKKFGK